MKESPSCPTDEPTRTSCLQATLIMREHVTWRACSVLSYSARSQSGATTMEHEESWHNRRAWLALAAKHFIKSDHFVLTQRTRLTGNHVHQAQTGGSLEVACGYQPLSCHCHSLPFLGIPFQVLPVINGNSGARTRVHDLSSPRLDLSSHRHRSICTTPTHAHR